MLIPSSVIASSPTEFIDLYNYRNPLHFLANSACYAAGFFLLWAGIIYWMLDGTGRRRFSLLLHCGALCGVVTFMCFGRQLGTLTPSLAFETAPVFSASACGVNLAVIAAVCALCVLLFKSHARQVLPSVLAVLAVSGAGLSVANIAQAQRQIARASPLRQDTKAAPADEPVITLSRTGKNVIVFMLDRAINGFFPMCLAEKPTLEAQFSGFTYYPNTISFGGHTIFGAPPLFGGYEYTPKAMEARSTEPMVSKHNEALRVLPVLFAENGYDVTVCDVPLANYQWIPDMSIYSDYPQIKTHITTGAFTENLHYAKGADLEKSKRNFFCYAIFKIAPLAVQPLLYDGGDYFSSKEDRFSAQFLNSYAVLASLCDTTRIVDTAEDTFLMINNETPHRETRLYLPNYDIFPDEAAETTTEAAAPYYQFQTELQTIHYHVNMASLLQLGKWFDFMKANGVYDNTRIIIAADHGFKTADQAGLQYFSDTPQFSGDERLNYSTISVDCFNPLLLVKDFGSTALATDRQFMTNADVPALAVSGIIEHAKNPFTGMPLASNEKTAHAQSITTSANFSPPMRMNATALDISDGVWLSVHDDIFKAENWQLEE